MPSRAYRDGTASRATCEGGAKACVSTSSTAGQAPACLPSRARHPRSAQARVTLRLASSASELHGALVELAPASGCWAPGQRERIEALTRLFISRRPCRAAIRQRSSPDPRGRTGAGFPHRATPSGKESSRSWSNSRGGRAVGPDTAPRDAALRAAASTGPAAGGSRRRLRAFPPAPRPRHHRCHSPATPLAGNERALLEQAGRGDRERHQPRRRQVMRDINRVSCWAIWAPIRRLPLEPRNARSSRSRWPPPGHGPERRGSAGGHGWHTVRGLGGPSDLKRGTCERIGGPRRAACSQVLDSPTRHREAASRSSPGRHFLSPGPAQ